MEKKGITIITIAIVLVCGICIAGSVFHMIRKAQREEKLSSSGENIIEEGTEESVEESDSEPDDADRITDLPSDEVLLISKYSNYAELPTEKGYFITTGGEVYEFDLSRTDRLSDYSKRYFEFVPELEMIRDNSEPIATISMDAVKKIYAKGIKIDKDAKMTEMPRGCDMGQKTIYFYNFTEKRLLECRSQGDVDCTSTDKNARKVAELYDELKDFNPGQISQDLQLCTATEIFVGTFPCSEEIVADKYMVYSVEDLIAAEEKYGFDLSAVRAEMDEYDLERFVYMLEFVPKADSAEVPEAVAIMRKNGSFDYLTDRTVETGEYGACYVAFYPKSYETMDDTYTDFEGNTWKVFEK